MAVSSGFFNASQSSSGRDRVYSAEDFGAIFDGIISDGIFKKYGDTPFKVVASDNASTGHLEVIVKPGRAWFDKTWTLNSEDCTVELDSRDAGAHRLDGIYIKIDKDSRANSIWVEKGDEVPVAPSLKPVINIPGHVTYYLIATVHINPNIDPDSPIIGTEITDMIGVFDGAPYVESLVTDPDITVSTILKNLESQFDSYQSQYSDSFDKWFNDIKDDLGTISADQVIEIAEIVANTYSTGYLSGQYPYTSDDCLYLSPSKAEIPPVIINFGFVTGSMYPNPNANECIVYTGTIETGG